MKKSINWVLFKSQIQSGIKFQCAHILHSTSTYKYCTILSWQKYIVRETRTLFLFLNSWKWNIAFSINFWSKMKYCKNDFSICCQLKIYYLQWHDSEVRVWDRYVRLLGIGFAFDVNGFMFIYVVRCKSRARIA